MSRFKGLLFDKDGTLFDFRRTWEAWADRFLRRIADGPEHAARLGAGIGFDLHAQRFEPGSVVVAGTPYDIAEAMVADLPQMTVPRLVAIMNEEAAKAPQSEAVPLAPLLGRLRDMGFVLGVATNDAEAPARAHLNAAGILDQFAFVAGSDSGFGGKPEPGQLIAFAQHAGLPPAACVMIGDSLHDLRAGRAAGFATVGVLTGLAQPAELAPFAETILPDIGALPDWLTASA